MVANFGIIIPTYNREEKLRSLLQSIESTSSEYEITAYIVSNGFSAKTQELSRQFKFCQYSFSNEVGVNKARNHGLLQAFEGHEFLILLDDDCVIADQRFFQAISEHYSNNPKTDILGGYYRDSKDSSRLDKLYNRICQQWIHYNRIGQNHWTLLGGCLVLRSNIINARYLFDENITYGSSETEFLYRLHQNDFNISYSSKVFVEHRPSITFIKLFKKAYKQGFFTAKYNIQSYPKRYLILGEPDQRKKTLLFNIVDKLYRFFFHIGLRSGQRSS